MRAIESSIKIGFTLCCLSALAPLHRRDMVPSRPQSVATKGAQMDELRSFPEESRLVLSEDPIDFLYATQVRERVTEPRQDGLKASILVQNGLVPVKFTAQSARDANKFLRVPSIYEG